MCHTAWIANGEGNGLDSAVIGNLGPEVTTGANAIAFQRFQGGYAWRRAIATTTRGLSFWQLRHDFCFGGMAVWDQSAAGVFQVAQAARINDQVPGNCRCPAGRSPVGHDLVALGKFLIAVGNGGRRCNSRKSRQ